MKNALTYLLLLIFTAIIPAQEVSADKLLDEIKSEFEKIKDYQVDATIKIDVDFLKIPETTGKIYFKQPDKIKLVSNSFALIPKEGLNFSPGQFLNYKYSAILAGEEKLDSTDTYIVKVIPLSNNSDVILTTLWIDKDRPLVRKIETTTKKNGTVKISLQYNNDSNVLPSEMELFLDLQNFRVPHSITGTITDTSKKNKDRKETVSGKVIITYKNYVINKGIDDNIFN